MKLSDISNLNKEDILAALGLEQKSSMTSEVLATVGIFGLGLLVGAAGALLLAPKSGQDLREDLGQRIRTLRDEQTNAAGGRSSGKSAREEAIT
jgi:hypothetical protein